MKVFFFINWNIDIKICLCRNCSWLTTKIKTNTLKNKFKTNTSQKKNFETNTLEEINYKKYQKIKILNTVN